MGPQQYLAGEFPLPDQVVVLRSLLLDDELGEVSTIPGESEKVLVPLATAKAVWKRQLEPHRTPDTKG